LYNTENLIDKNAKCILDYTCRIWG